MNSEKGQSLLEVIIAMTVGILVVVALVFATIFSLRNASFAKNSAQATKLAQEGIERVKLGRDRDALIINSSNIAGCTNVYSWNGNTTGNSSLWSCQIHANGGCDNPSNGSKCYFTVNSVGVLTSIQSLTSFPSSSYEGIPSSVNPLFKRVITLSDDSASVPLSDGTTISSFMIQKTATVIVQWTDFAGTHESRLTTILRKL